jgi:hypothetical protein
MTPMKRRSAAPTPPNTVWRRIVTPDLNRAHSAIHQLEAGICWINTWGIPGGDAGWRL